MKTKFIIIFLAFIGLGIGGNLLWEIIENKEKVKVYVLYDPDKDERINWPQYKNIFPEDFDHTKILVDIGELLKLDKNQLKIYDSIIAGYYSQHRLVKENNGENFYLTINQNEAVLLKKIKKVKEISDQELVDYPIVSLDSVIKIIPGLEYLQLKNSEKMKFIDNLNFHIIEPAQGSDIFKIYQIEPIVEHYD